MAQSAGWIAAIVAPVGVVILVSLGALIYVLRRSNSSIQRQRRKRHYRRNAGDTPATIRPLDKPIYAQHYQRMLQRPQAQRSQKAQPGWKGAWHGLDDAPPRHARHVQTQTSSSPASHHHHHTSHHHRHREHPYHPHNAHHVNHQEEEGGRPQNTTFAPGSPKVPSPIYCPIHSRESFQSHKLHHIPQFCPKCKAQYRDYVAPLHHNARQLIVPGMNLFAESVEEGTRTGISSGSQSDIQTGTQAGVQTGTQTGVQAGIQTGVQTGVQAGIQTGVQTGVQTGIQTSIQTGNQTVSQIGNQTGIQTGIHTGTLTGTQHETRFSQSDSENIHGRQNNWNESREAAPTTPPIAQYNRTWLDTGSQYTSSLKRSGNVYENRPPTPMQRPLQIYPGPRRDSVRMPFSFQSDALTTSQDRSSQNASTSSYEQSRDSQISPVRQPWVPRISPLSTSDKSGGSVHIKVPPLPSIVKDHMLNKPLPQPPQAAESLKGSPKGSAIESVSSIPTLQSAQRHQQFTPKRSPLRDELGRTISSPLRYGEIPETGIPLQKYEVTGLGSPLFSSSQRELLVRSMLKPSPPLRIPSKTSDSSMQRTVNTSRDNIVKTSPLRKVESLKESIATTVNTPDTMFTAQSHFSPDAREVEPLSTEDLAFTPPKFPPQLTLPAMRSNSSGFMNAYMVVYRAVYPYKPVLEDEMDLRIGDRVFVHRRFDDGWCVAERLDGDGISEGVVPQICLVRED
uniref:ARAD1B01430p n=1 Tax=Blastobotrys adeninivorans TaxID=409370 RepID=A0A060TAL9_BLAAD